jgi:hypothetical protein
MYIKRENSVIKHHFDTIRPPTGGWRFRGICPAQGPRCGYAPWYQVLLPGKSRLLRWAFRGNAFRENVRLSERRAGFTGLDLLPLIALLAAVCFRITVYIFPSPFNHATVPLAVRRLLRVNVTATEHWGNVSLVEAVGRTTHSMKVARLKGGHTTTRRGGT